jgi:hypothetical protein
MLFIRQIWISILLVLEEKMKELMYETTGEKEKHEDETIGNSNRDC